MQLNSRSPKSLKATIWQFYAMAFVVIVCGTAMIAFSVGNFFNKDQERHLHDESRLVAGQISHLVDIYKNLVINYSREITLRDVLNFADHEVAMQWSHNIISLLPGVIGVAIFDSKGNILGNAEQQRVGPACLADIKGAVEGQQIAYPPVHREHAGLEHFDMVQPIKQDGRSIGFLFISFHLDVIRQQVESMITAMGQSIYIRDGADNIFVQKVVGPATLDASRDAWMEIPRTDWALSYNDHDNPTDELVLQMVAIGLATFLLTTFGTLVFSRRVVSIFKQDILDIRRLIDHVRDDRDINVERFSPRVNEVRDILLEVVSLARSEAEEKNKVLQLSEDINKAMVKAELANEAKGIFLANMSHEIRTPMNAIIGMSYLAMQTRLDETQANYLKKINASAESLLGIINDILDFSKIEAGKLDLETVDFALADVFENVRSVLELKTQEKRIGLDFHCDSQIPRMIQGDPLRLTQILMNLGGNAVKFTPEGGEVEVTCEVLGPDPHDDNQLWLQFSVRDSGIGLSVEQEEKLFKAFSQGDSSTTREYGGTGLGLKISKTLVEMMAGRIWVESEPGQGATFYFTVQLGRSVQADGEMVYEPQQSTDYDRACAAIKGIKVLLVEDNPINQEIALEILVGHGMFVETANDGQEALDLLDKETFDGVLMDCYMPVMDGYKATEAIRAQARFRDLPILALSANAMKEDYQKVIDVGMNQLIPKPINVNVMIITMAKWMRPDAAVSAVKPGASADS
jgi:signal transduction histidine kinase/ActR/RegA family two-component response regulator